MVRPRAQACRTPVIARRAGGPDGQTGARSGRTGAPAGQAPSPERRTSSPLGPPSPGGPSALRARDHGAAERRGGPVPARRRRERAPTGRRQPRGWRGCHSGVRVTARARGSARSCGAAPRWPAAAAGRRGPRSAMGRASRRVQARRLIAIGHLRRPSGERAAVAGQLDADPEVLGIGGEPVGRQAQGRAPGRCPRGARVPDPAVAADEPSGAKARAAMTAASSARTGRGMSM